MDCIDLAEDRDMLRALVNTVMNLRVSYNAGKFTANRPLCTRTLYGTNRQQNHNPAVTIKIILKCATL
jgi:hypothetical protein